MKKIYLYLFFFFSSISVFSQTTINLIFEAKDAQSQNPLSLDSLYIKNLTENCDTILFDSISSLVVNAIWPVGINEPNPANSGGFILNQNYPNPFQGSTNVSVYREYGGTLNLMLFDATGRKLAAYKNEFDKGFHTFQIRSSSTKVLILLVFDNKNNKSIKIISTGQGQSVDMIQYIGETPGIEARTFKNLESNGFIIYLGNQMLYTAYANGYINQTIIDNPTADSTYSFNMVTVSAPIVTTSIVSNIAQTIATSGGNVSSDGGFTVSARGVCWDTSPNPTLSDYYTIDGSDTGNFISYLSGLTPNTQYYLKAYATNNLGTGYGNEEQFTTTQIITVPIVSTLAVTSITQTTAESGGNVTNDGGAPVTARGVCWSISPNPTILDYHTTNGSGTGTYTSSLTGLLPNTLYYLKSYATNNIGTGYGSEVQFTTGQTITTPNVSTTAVSNIAQTTATSGGNVSADGGATVTARGVCWGTTANPIMTGNHTTDGSGTGTFTSNLTGLVGGTLYYVRAYATNSAGTSYGNELTFTTLALPTVSTTAVINIAQTTATSGGNVSADGGATVTARGVCWGTTTNPTTTGNHTTDGIGTGTFISNLTGLTGGTLYYVRGYATNSAGTSYGNEITFTTLALPTVSTAAVTNITQTTATSGGNVSSDGGATVTARGVCWGTSTNPITTGNHTTDGIGTGTFISNLTGLAGGTLYYVRAYATNSAGTSYGNELTFTTLALPTVSTAAVTNIAQTTATSGGNVSADGGATVTVRGVCWGTASNPIITGNHTTDGIGTGTFISNLTGLAGGTLYYVRAYATNSAGTSYGNELTFTTLALPTVTTTAVSNIALTTATSGGNISADGGATVNARGVCWGTAANPISTGNHTTDGIGTGTFISNLTGLAGGTLYYIRAYATNSTGTSYGDEITFTTLSPFSCGQPVLFDGKNYNTVQIGAQCWFKENLNVGTRINGVVIQTNNSIPEKHCYNDLEANCNIYGGLYQWDEMMNYTATSSANPSGRQGICPDGWHIPSDAEWCQMEIFIDPTVDCNASFWRGTDVGGKMKETGTIHWSNPNNGATNSSGFTTLPGGLMWNGYSNNLHDSAFLWTATDSGISNAWSRSLNTLDVQDERVTFGKDVSFSVRCLKDGTITVVPTVTTASVSNIAANSSTSGGNVIQDGGTTITARGVCWNTSPNPTIANNHTTDGTGMGIFISSLAGLIPTTLYYVRAYATNSAGTAYGNEISFTTLNPFSCGQQVLFNGKSYNTVQIGTQCWFKENLNVGTRINVAVNQTNNGTTEKHCYNNLEANCDIYGGLYQWDEMMNYTATSSANPSGRQGICPTGWHIPSDAEWCQMENFLDPASDCSDLFRQGSYIAGGMNKETGTSHWASPNTGATNTSGFTALPGGVAMAFYGDSYGIADSANFWSASVGLYAGYRMYRSCHYNNAYERRDMSLEYSMSVRCIKDPSSSDSGNSELIKESDKPSGKEPKDFNHETSIKRDTIPDKRDKNTERRKFKK